MPEENEPIESLPPEPPTVLGQVSPDEMFARAMQTVKMTGGPGHWEPPSLEKAAGLFPGYEVLKLLGRGGMGAVYQAREIELDRMVAIKLLPLEVSVDPDFADRFRREARAMAKLHHPNILTVFAFGTTSEGHLFFVMEYVEGANLAEVIRLGGLTGAQALATVEQICTALAYAHGKGIVHRDIKPANVMVDTESRVKVADFGLARLTEPGAEQLGHTMTGTVMGTPDYMAPEQMRGMTVDHRADIYSLGVMLYEMLCREVPKGIFDPPSHRTDCDTRIDAIVIKAMHQAPERRYQSTEEMKADVVAARTPVPAATGNPAQAQASRPAAVAMKSMKSPGGKQSKGPLLAVAAVVACAGVAGALYLGRSRPAASGPATGVPVVESVSGPEPVGASSNAAGTSGGRDAAAPKRDATAEAWVNALDDPCWEGFPAGYQRTPEGFYLTQARRWVFKKGPTRNGAVRIRLALDRPTALPGVSCRLSGDHWYFPALSSDLSNLIIRRKDATVFTSLTTGALLQPLHLGDDVEIELRAVGSHFTAKVNGAIVAETDDSAICVGQLGLWMSGDKRTLIKRLEYLDLDPPRTGVLAMTDGASRDRPYANALGMRFVPVPITGGPTQGQRLLFSIWETRVEDYELFALETKREWKKPDFEQGAADPAVKISWDEARAFCDWLTERDHLAGKLTPNESYRLPTDHEWSCATGIGDRGEPAATPEENPKIDGVFPWGNTWPPSPNTANLSGEERAGGDLGAAQKILAGYRDAFPTTAPVGSFAANALGLFDLAGNAAEWCEDARGPESVERVQRGGSWAESNRTVLLTSHRLFARRELRFETVGFRPVIVTSPRH